jgi:hypothetical protein
VLSIEQYVITIADRIAPTDLLTGKVSLPVRIVMSAIFAVGCTVVADRPPAVVQHGRRDELMLAVVIARG